MISAGENPMDIDRVSCFLSAVMGFSPFIFDLQSDSSLNDTIESFEKVSKVQDIEKLKNNWVSFLTFFAWCVRAVVLGGCCMIVAVTANSGLLKCLK